MRWLWLSLALPTAQALECYEGWLTPSPLCIQVCKACCPKAYLKVQGRDPLPLRPFPAFLTNFIGVKSHKFCGFWWETTGLCHIGKCHFFWIVQIDSFPACPSRTGGLQLPVVETNGHFCSATLEISLPDLPAAPEASPNPTVDR